MIAYNILDFLNKFVIPILGWFVFAIIACVYLAIIIAAVIKLARWIDRKTTRKVRKVENEE